MSKELLELIAKDGVASILASLRTVLSQEADDLRETGNEMDATTADKLDAIASDVLGCAARLNELS